MNTPPNPEPPQGCWIVPYAQFKLADGTIVLKPQKALLRANAKITTRLTHVSPSTLARLADSGFIRCVYSTPDCRNYYPAEVEAFLQETSDNPDYWTPERRKQYGLARKKSPRKRPKK